ncbi:hypothetical protein PFMALIP_05919, partial [Plasmodium falciparum MaliPS096_E11]
MARGLGAKEDESAKDAFDRIGKIVHDQVKNGADGTANKYIEELKGNLQKAASTSSETASTNKTCDLVKQYYGRADKSKRYPCGNATGDAKKEERFSDTQGAECANSKMRSGGIGACAPYRRLHLCNKNMEKMDTIKNDSKAKDNLLLEVCLAAHYEGDSINTHYTKHKQIYGDSASEMCTMLARSFADIGDIVRGRDLYGGNNKRRKQLDDNLKTIFTQIYNELTTRGKNGQTNSALQARYGNDPKGNYYQLREDWWEANRKQIWQAMTCSEQLSNASYFHATCGDSERSGTLSQANNYCRCNNDQPGEDKANVDPPTYFDYVPQYLRWFEEWAEDFCRKKKHKLKDVKTNCLDEAKGKYCSLNGYDCTKTKLAVGKYRMGNQCTKCFFSCYPYVDWINNQKEQFDKQREKYEKEITGGSGSKKRNVRSNYDNGYEKKFYEKLKGEDVDLDKFLNLLSKEKTCKEVQDDKGGKIDFKTVKRSSASGGRGSGASGTNEKEKGTFYRSDYCQPCPYCGMKRKSDGSNEWERKRADDDCKRGKRYKPKGGAAQTDIRILKSGKGETEIKEKLEAFCEEKNGGVAGVSAGGKNSNNQDLYEEWKCYNDVEKDGQDGVDDDDEEDVKKVKDAGGLCILENKNKKEKKTEPEPDQFQKTFNDFFYYWVAHMLKDSIYWRTKKLERCLKNGTKTKCRKGCKGDCDCFQNWITQKQKEWGKIKVHFDTQDFGSNGPLGHNAPLGSLFSCPVFVLQCNLQEEFLKGDSEDGSTEDKQNSLDAEEIQQLRKMLKEIGVVGGGPGAMCGIDVAALAAFAVSCTKGGVAEQKTIMDKFLEKELQEAKECIKKCEEQEREGLARAAVTSPDDQPPLSKEEEEEDSEDEEEHQQQQEEEEEKETEEEVPPEVQEEEEEQPEDTTKVTGQGEEKEPKEEVDACGIVNTLFTTPGSLNAACEQKYSGNNSRLGWKCISGNKTATDSEAKDRHRRDTSGDGKTTTSSAKSGDTSGSICIPPRRRKLYVTPLSRWAEEATKSSVASGDQSTSESSVQTASQIDGKPAAQPNSHPASPSNSRDDAALREAFIQSAAVETFFLWHRYKKEWMAQKAAEKARENGEVVGVSHDQESPSEDDPKHPQNKLQQTGVIPPEFLRQMFYTLADYKDILFSGGTSDSGSNDTSDSKGTSNSNDNLKNIVLLASGSTEQEKENMQKIQAKIKKILNGDNNQESAPPSLSVEKTTPTEWWSQNGEHIWKGMICALTYNTDTPSGTPPQKVQAANGGEDLFKKLKTQYGVYESVKLEEEEASGDKTYLSKFVLRPPYFRYLEEWGETFCRQRTRMLEKIKEDCKVDKGDGERCSGDGESCETVRTQDYDILPDFNCPGCGISCSSYRKWIERKKIEFHKQSNAYNNQKQRYQREREDAGSNKDDKEFCTKLEKTWTTAGDFLQTLKNGPCKNENENGKDKLDFTKPDDTFKHAKNCKPCSQFSVNCKNGKCTSGSGTKSKCDGKKPITKDHIKDLTEEVVMRVSDNSITGFAGDLEACGSAGIFTGIIEKKWKCGKVCGVDICEQTNVNGGTDGKEYIQIRALLKRWVQYFLEDYNKINDKISHCTNTVEGSKCINGCQNKCTC